MPNFFNSIKERFSKYGTSKILHIIILVLSLIVFAVLTPLSIIESEASPLDCDLNQIIYITEDQSSIYSNFTSFISKTKKTLDISISIPEDVTQFPKFWKDTFDSLRERQISIRVFTDNKNVIYDDYVEIRYLKKSEKNNEIIKFYMNFAVSDGVDVFFPSVFYFDDNPNRKHNTYSYIVQLNDCSSTGNELLALFNILWTQKSTNNQPLKHSFLPKNTTNKTFSFLVEPISEFPIGLTNITSTLYDFMSLSYLNKFIITHSVFPNLDKITSKKSKINLSHKSALTSSLFEVAEEIVEDQETYLMISYNHFNKHKTKFLSMISNMIANSTSVCNNAHFQGTIIASSSFKISKLFLLQSGISHVFTGDMVLGLSINVDSLVFDNVSALFSNNPNCTKLAQPKIKM